jgi:UDP-N-acetylglucosamine transferase subunit ALG13
VDVLWQVGATRVDRMPRDARPQVPIAEMRAAMREADVVVSHAGVGSALAAMQAGRRAVYVPRRRQHGEHIDDHQVAMAHELDARGLVLAREAGEVTMDDLSAGTEWEIRAGTRVEPFRLVAP